MFQRQLLTILLFLLLAMIPGLTPVRAAEPSWAMAGANPQRTSWVAEAVNPATATNFGVTWYRPIEAYIGQHVQLVAARNKIYVSTARGLYALNAATGALVWRFDTELPLGHSPTVDGSTIYVGGFDHRLYALDADTGALRWTFEGAGAGFSTNPLVVEGKVLLGNRDGYFYAVNQTTGNVVWQYPAVGQEPLGPILYSAAYKDGTVFFAANDNYAYALNVANGTLVWRSQQLPGDGYQAWWPVVYGDHVIFSAAVAYADETSLGTHSVREVVDPSDPYYDTMHQFQYSTDFVKTLQRDDVFHQGEPQFAKLGPEFTSGGSGDPGSITWSWPNGKTVVNATKATEYLEDDGQTLVNRPANKPWRRNVIVLDAANGAELTMDSDGDGHLEYAPFLFAGTKSGNRYPPLVIPTKNAAGQTNNVLYLQNFFRLQGGYGISQAQLFAWQFGTPYLHPISDEGFAIDEPMAHSAGGDILYSSLCCDRVGSWQNLVTGQGWVFWGYTATLESIKLPFNQIQDYFKSLAPGYDMMWTGASMWDNYPRLYGSYGSINGIYHNHGHQNPMIPYNGRLYIHRSNAIIALGPNAPQLRRMTSSETPAEYEANIRQEYPNVSLPLLPIDSPDQELPALVTIDEVSARLNKEISKMLQAGHLRPGYYNSTRGSSELANYFDNPGDTLLILLQAYPHVSPAMQPDLKKYIDQHYRRYFSDQLYSVTGHWINNPSPYNLNSPTGYGQLQAREWMPLPPEIELDLRNKPISLWPEVGTQWEWPPHNVYAMWLYAKTFYSSDPATLSAIYQKSKARYQTAKPNNDTLINYPWLHNAAIAGYIGFLNLQTLAGAESTDAALRATVQNNLNTLLSKRATEFFTDHPWTSLNDPNLNRRNLAVARNFMYFTPELAEYLRDNASSTVTEALDEYQAAAPYWLASRYEAAFAEFASDSLYTNNAMFQANAYFRRQSDDELRKYLDVPAFKVGDLFYIQNLVATIESAEPSFGMNILPRPQLMETGGTLNLPIELTVRNGFSETVTLSHSSGATDLDISFVGSPLVPPGQVTMTVTDLHTPGSLNSGLFRTIPIIASSASLQRQATVIVLVNGAQLHLPAVFKTR